MIKTTVFLFALAVIVCGIIIFRPFSDGDDIASDHLVTPIGADADVTRAAPTDTSALALAAVAATSDSTNRGPAPATASAPRRADVARPNTDDTQLSDMTNNVLAELGFAGV